MNTQAILKADTSASIPEAVIRAQRAIAQSESSYLEAPAPEITKTQVKLVDDEESLFVYDKTATKGPRMHDFRDGRGIAAPYVFADNKTPVAVPFSAAIRLVENNGFTVIDAEGNILTASKERDEKVTLKSNETIARYDQLTAEALGEKLISLSAPSSVKRKEDMIAWLVNYNEQRSDARSRAEASGMNRSLAEIIADAGGDADAALRDMNSMSEDVIHAVAGAGDGETVQI
jgi:hypothetical protein